MRSIRNKELGWKLPVLMLIMIVIVTSVFNFRASDIGGLPGTGGPSISGDKPYITRRAYGTKVSFIINPNEEVGNKWYIDGSVVKDKMPVSHAGGTGLPSWGGVSVDQEGRFPIYFLAGTGADSAKEIRTGNLGTNARFEYATIQDLRYSRSTSFPTSQQETLANSLNGVLAKDWYNGAISGRGIESSFNLKGGYDLTLLRDKALDSDENDLKAFWEEAKPNILFNSVLLKSAQDAGWSHPDLTAAIETYDYMMTQAFEGLEAVEPPNEFVEVVVIVEPLVGVGDSGDTFLTTIRTFEAIILNNNHGLANSAKVLEEAKGTYFGSAWLTGIIQDLLGISWGGNISWKKPNNVGDPVSFSNHYTGPMPGRGADQATLEDRLLGFGAIYTPTLTKPFVPTPTVTLVKVHEYGQMVNGEFVVDDELTHHEIIPIMDNKNEPSEPDFGKGAWYNPAVFRWIPEAKQTLISRKDLVVGDNAGERNLNKDGDEEVADFGTENLREWWSTTNATKEEGYHRKRGTADKEIDMSQGGDDRGNRLTSQPAVLDVFVGGSKSVCQLDDVLYV